MKNYIILLTSLLALSACGGGGSESDSSVSNTSASSSASQQTNSNSNSDNSSQTDNSDSSSDDTNNEDNASSNSEVIMTSLTIDQSFDLKTDFDLLIDAKISTGNVRAYLNVCQSKVDSNKADYQNCVLRKPIKNGELSQQLTLSRQDIALVAEIWLYDNNPKPLRYQWQYDENVTQQQFEIRY